MAFGEETNQYVREFLAEMLGTFALVIFGDGAIAQVVLGNAGQGSTFFGGFLNISLGYGLALMIGICISGGVSGGHLNPAVTVAMAAIQKLKPIKVPIYMAGQYLGAFLAALVLWGNYADAINMVEEEGYSDKTMGIFASYPSFAETSTVTLAMDQMLGTALLLIIILAVTDDNNMNIQSSLVPITIGLGLTAIHLSFGLNAGCAINPARDFSPRLLTFIAGWENPFKASNNWFWIPWLLPHVGAVIGAGLYTVMVGLHNRNKD